MSGTIASTVVQGITLSAESTTVTGSGAIETTTGDAVIGTGHGWTFGNSGIITTAESGTDGVSLTEGGVVTNLGTIAAYRNGIDVTGAAATITNSGLLDSDVTKIVKNVPLYLYNGIYLAEGGMVTNTAGGVIYGGIGGIAVNGAAGTVSNAGDIHVTTLQGNGITLEKGGDVTNLAGGGITGDFAGVAIYGGVANLVNAGNISAMELGGYSVYLQDGGTLTNLAGGTITGSTDGVLTGNGTINGVSTGLGRLVLSNAGYIYGGAAGVSLLAGGTIANTGTIIGTTGVSLSRGTLINAGTIRAESLAGNAVSFGLNQADRLVVEAGAVFAGAVKGGGGGSVLELAADPVPGTLLSLAGLGTTITNFSTIAFDPGADWQLAGTVGAFDAGQTITGFAQGDTIQLNGVTGLAASFNTATDQLTLTGAAQPYILQFDSAFNGETLVSGTSGGNTTLTLIPCFASGTCIATPGGQTRVEALRPGDRVLTQSGELLPIVWTGQRRVDCDAHPEPARVRPIRIAAHAFGEHEPHRDLLLSPDHAILVQDVLVPVKHLVNGQSIRQLDMPMITYHHLELPHHAVILAEGLPCESYLDTGDRIAFADHGGQILLYPVFGGETRDVMLVRDALACAPLRVMGEEVDAVRSLLAARIPLTEAQTLTAG
jgi:hypothetical protein